MHFAPGLKPTKEDTRSEQGEKKLINYRKEMFISRLKSEIFQVKMRFQE